MIHFDLPKQKSSIIKVLGVGGGGSNAVNFMHEQNIEGVDFIICNTDAKALEQSKVPNKIQLGPHLTQGLGAGANPEVGKKATEESLQEIKSILEVNTKMAFITAGMGGGTGTGGGPIVAQICKELGILTVGIVTTPFGFEGPRRMVQAEEGIMQLKPYVDTLLVISNDKLRMQYGNLRMKEAFSKADNVLATAAKCITDIINSRGHIIVDFADVCTVMKNGGVAILGKAEVEGENRAERAIEEALNSPLLNDNDIKGAKWILININSAEGDHECTMDEIEVINNYLRMQAGENTDVIVGMGYDNTLDKKIGITMIATGFEHKNPFEKQPVPKKEEPKPEKIVMTLGLNENQEKVANPTSAIAETEMKTTVDSFAPHIKDDIDQPSAPISWNTPEEREALLDARETEVLQFELSTEITTPVPTISEEKKEIELLNSIQENIAGMKLTEKPEAVPSILSKPVNIYVESELTEVPKNILNTPNEEKQETRQEKIAQPIINNEKEVVSEVKHHHQERSQAAQPSLFQYNNDLDESEEQRRRATERLHRLRNLSYNMNSNDPNNEFDSVPAYVRRKMELFGNNQLASVENFYSKLTVEKDENNQTQISSLNNFLDGKKPD
ncbi:cell division protein FtsZ [Hydrotalea sp.]|uniref:cell division protein FtsZ n=1 Tax=Hydrotalea sp. TaxID=2881279 RepID=UPI002603039C|nr:cell division protein FtsZ [Hydrotalea sp.]